MAVMMAMFAASSVLSVAGGLASHQAGVSAAHAQGAANARRMTEATRQYNSDVQQIEKQSVQDRDAVVVDKFEAHKMAAQARATAATSAGESGVKGNSVEALARDFFVQEGNAEMKANRAWLAREDNRSAQIKTSYQNVRNTVAGLQTPQMPSKLGTALKIGSEIMGSAIAMGMHKGGGNTPVSKTPQRMPDATTIY